MKHIVDATSSHIHGSVACFCMVLKGMSVDGGVMVMWEVLRDVERCNSCRGFILQSLGKCESKKCLPVFLSASFYQKIQQTMKIQEIPRKSKVLEYLGYSRIFKPKKARNF